MDEHSLTDRASFGAWLRRERERRGLTLDLIASRTKIAGSLLAGLEEGDLSRWPAGIFRRAFVRAYAEAVGLDPDHLLTEFAVVHPDVGQAVVTVPRRVAGGGIRADALRLTLAEASRRAWLDVRKIAGVAVDALVFALVLLGAWLAVPGWLAVGTAWLVLTIYVAVGVLVVDSTPGLWCVMRLWATRGSSDEASAEARHAVGEGADATVVPFQRARRRRRPQRPALDAERQSRTGGEGRARTH